MDIKNKSKVFLALYCVTFFATWGIFELYFKDSVKEVNPYLSLVVKFFVWTLPIILIVKYIFKHNILSYLQMNENVKEGLKVGVIVGLLVAAYHMARIIILQKVVCPSFDLYSIISIVILIGFTEEVVFRGFILTELQKMTRFWAANLLSSVLFLMIHFPKWFKEGVLMDPGIIGSFTYVICFGLLAGYVFRKTKSIWPCMIIHSVNNFMTTFFNV